MYKRRSTKPAIPMKKAASHNGSNVSLDSTLHYREIRQSVREGCRYVVIGAVPAFNPDAMAKCRVEYNLNCPPGPSPVEYSHAEEEKEVYLTFLLNTTHVIEPEIYSRLKSLEERIKSASADAISANVNAEFGNYESSKRQLFALHQEYSDLQKPNAVIEVKTPKRKFKGKQKF